MLRWVPGILMLLCLQSCSNKETGKPDASPVTPVALQDNNFSLPMFIDSAFIARADSTRRMGFAEVRALNGNFADIEGADVLRNFLNDFCTIDSLKQKGKYEKYLETIDIGHTQDAYAFRLGQIAISPKASMVLWSLNISSYEACPVFTGSFVIGTLVNGESHTHIPLGKNYNVVDPPAYLSERYTSEITDKWIAVNSETLSDDDMDMPGDNREMRCYTIQIREVMGDSASAAGVH